MNARHHFSDLGKRIDELVGQLRTQAPNSQKDKETLENEASDSIEPRLQSLVLDGSNKVSTLRDTTADTVQNIIIPGISTGKSQLQLVASISQHETEDDSTSLTDESEPAEVEGHEKILDTLAATMEAPLVAIGSIEPDALCRAAKTEDNEGLWAQWWLDVRMAEDGLKWKIAQQCIGPWFARWIIGRVAPVIVGPERIDRTDSIFQRLVVLYIDCDNTSPLGVEVAWQTILCTAGALAGDCSPGALTLATRLLAISEEQQRLEPSLMLAHIFQRVETHTEDQMQR
ncbi:hypothetical protein COEREDRAFT_81116, partial [Coemansia reversa NRRL 1564]